ncbi:hypothetical protein ACFQ0B_71085 [Nonomuraea thailandensis]
MALDGLLRQHQPLGDLRVRQEAARLAARWLMPAEATGEDGKRARGWVTGLDPYGMTAVIAVEGARRLVSDGAPAGR